MEMRFLASICVQAVMLAAVVKPVPLPNGGSISAANETSRTLLQVQEAGSAKRIVQLSLKRDRTVKPNSGVSLKLVGQPRENVLIVTDEYDSLPGSLSFRQAASEQFLRVITLGLHPAQTFCLKLKSCYSSTELTDPGLVWNQKDSTLTIHWLPSPSSSEPRSFAQYKVESDGKVSLVSEQRRNVQSIRPRK